MGARRAARRQRGGTRTEHAPRADDRLLARTFIGPAGRRAIRSSRVNPPRVSFAVRAHLVGIEQTEKNRYVVTVDGRRLASFCSESRARAAGRLEARRLDMVAQETARGRR